MEMNFAMNRLSVTLESQTADLTVNGIHIRVVPDDGCEMPPMRIRIELEELTASQPVEQPAAEPIEEEPEPEQIPAQEEEDPGDENDADGAPGEEEAMLDQWYSLVADMTEEERQQLREEILRRSTATFAGSSEW